MGDKKTYKIVIKYFLFQRKNIGKIITLFFFLINFSGCSPFHSELDQLGRSDYSDVDIDPDFSMDDFNNFNDNGVRDVTVVEQPQQGNGQLQQNPEENHVSFMVENQIFALANGEALRWKGCYRNQKVMGGYIVGNSCGDAFLHKDFYNNLNHVFFRCIQNSAEAAGYLKPVRVFIHHLGTYSGRQTRKGRRLSLHALASAMDIVKFELFDSSGNSREVSTFKRHYKGAQAVFYDEFRDCWKESLPEKCTPGKTEYQGSIGHEASRLGGSSLNNDHLHLSLPYCAMTNSDGLNFVSSWHSPVRQEVQFRSSSSGGNQRSFGTLSQSRIFNCDNTRYRNRNYLRHSCLKSMNLEEKAALVMEDASIINGLRREFYLDPRFSFCVTSRESGIAPNARGSANDYGMYQVTNSTARYVLNMHEPVVPFFVQYRENQSKYRKAMLSSTLAQADLHHSVMFAKAKQEGLADQINNNPENVYLLRRLATSYNGRGRRARRYGAKVARCYETMKQAVSKTGHIHNPSGIRLALSRL